MLDVDKGFVINLTKVIMLDSKVAIISTLSQTYIILHGKDLLPTCL